jgi:hypothetical protein
VCFSAEADLVAGIVISGAGIDALRHVKRRSNIPLASLPLVFGAHQLIETFTWWGLDGRVPEGVGTVALWAYLVIAFGVLPVLVPGAVYAIEPDRGRRRLLVPFCVLGIAVAAVLISELISGPVGAEVACRYIDYNVGISYGGQITALYVAATCGPLLLSSRRSVVVFGALNLVAVVTLALLLANGVISLWCAWAAVISLIVVVHLRSVAQHEARMD